MGRHPGEHVQLPETLSMPWLWPLILYYNSITSWLQSSAAEHCQQLLWYRMEISCTYFFLTGLYNSFGLFVTVCYWCSCNNELEQLLCMAVKVHSRPVQYNSGMTRKKNPTPLRVLRQTLFLTKKEKKEEKKDGKVSLKHSITAVEKTSK